jgi:5-methylcytosine-specific restriction endonuclease McrA
MGNHTTKRHRNGTSYEDSGKRGALARWGHLPDPESDSKACTGCGRVFPRATEYFSQNASKYDGLNSRCRECSRVQNNRYREQHREELARKQRAYVAANREVVLGKKRAYGNLPETRARVREKSREWRQANRWKRNEAQRVRRARKKGVLAERLPEWFVQQHCGDPCYYCGAPNADTWDHMIPLVRGGPHTLENLVRACRPCNSQKHTQTAEEFLNGR